jgi:hypothetical protein
MDGDRGYCGCSGALSVRARIEPASLDLKLILHHLESQGAILRLLETMRWLIWRSEINGDAEEPKLIAMNGEFVRSDGSLRLSSRLTAKVSSP